MFRDGSRDMFLLTAKERRRAMGLFDRNNVDDALKEEKSQEEIEKESNLRREQTSRTIRLLVNCILL